MPTFVPSPSASHNSRLYAQDAKNTLHRLRLLKLKFALRTCASTTDVESALAAAGATDAERAITLVDALTLPSVRPGTKQEVPGKLKPALDALCALLKPCVLTIASTLAARTERQAEVDAAEATAAELTIDGAHHQYIYGVLLIADSCF